MFIASPRSSIRWKWNAERPERLGVGLCLCEPSRLFGLHFTFIIRSRRGVRAPGIYLFIICLPCDWERCAWCAECGYPVIFHSGAGWKFGVDVLCVSRWGKCLFSLYARNKNDTFCTVLFAFSTFDYSDISKQRENIISCLILWFIYWCVQRSLMTLFYWHISLLF